MRTGLWNTVFAMQITKYSPGLFQEHPTKKWQIPVCTSQDLMPTLYIGPWSACFKCPESGSQNWSAFGYRDTRDLLILEDNRYHELSLGKGFVLPKPHPIALIPLHLSSLASLNTERGFNQLAKEVKRLKLTKDGLVSQCQIFINNWCS